MPYFLNEQRRLLEAIRELEIIISQRRPEEGADGSEGLMRLSHLLSQKHVALEDHIALCELMEVKLPSAAEVRAELDLNPLEPLPHVWR